MTTDKRPSCPRCGKTFRYPAGLAWHQEHNKDCAKWAQGRSEATK